MSERMDFVWLCDACGKPVGNNKGYIEVDWLEAMRRERQHRQRDRERQEWNLRELLALPGDVEWEVYHGGCDPHPDRDDYWFAVERCRTLGHLLDWNAHLSEKGWMASTDWYRFIQRRLAPHAVNA